MHGSTDTVSTIDPYRDRVELSSPSLVPSQASWTSSLRNESKPYNSSSSRTGNAMKIVQPQVYLIAATEIDENTLGAMLDELGAVNFSTEDTSGQDLIEVAGRLCYKSFEVGLNKNVTKVREGNKAYLENILKSHHGSVLEHSTATVAFLNVSRIFTHELCRHRAGVAISQESMRYVRMDDIPMHVPNLLPTWQTLTGADSAGKAVADKLQADFEASMRRVTEVAEEEIKKFSARLDDPPGVPFEAKKIITSALRRIAPGGHTTNIIVTANHRAWRHIIELRTAAGAEQEIRDVMWLVGELMYKEFPNIYQDLSGHPDASIKFTHSKV
jgi:thymidylate synthase (FAD)